MGMGEPLLNYKHVLNSINIITTSQGLAMSPKRIKGCLLLESQNDKKLADDAVKFNLAISLHSALDIKREKLMPINKDINLSK